VAFRVDSQNNLIAFAGSNCREITVDGRTTTFGEKPLSLVAFAPIGESRRVSGGAIGTVCIQGDGDVHIPAQGLPAKVKLFTQGPKPGSRAAEAASHRENQTEVVHITPAESGRQIWIVPAE
jgi:hypothetical protein